MLPIAVIVPLILLLIIILKDMSKAYVEVVDDKITVVDFYFGSRKEKKFLLQDIAATEIVLGGYSIRRVRGYTHSHGATYIVFRDKNDKYMFKVLCCPETKQFFANCIK